MMTDSFGQSVDYLRISVTDKCNARCVYCMPYCGIQMIRRENILSYEELAFVSRVCAQKGVKRVRITGGEPLVREGLASFVGMIRSIPGIESVRITTNGLLLSEQLDALVKAGIDGINISLDAIDERVYSLITRLPESEHSAKRVLEGIDAALSVPNLSVKINCVLSGLNDDEAVSVASLARNRKVCVRFIELMPLGCGKSPLCSFRSQESVLDALRNSFGELSVTDGARYQYYRAKGFAGTFGFISPVTHPFCASCNRLRLTSDGYIKSCLRLESRTNIRSFLSGGLTDEAASLVSDAIDREIAHKRGGVSVTNRYMNQIGG